MINVYLVDDQPDILLLWRMVIELDGDGLHVVGESRHPADVLAGDAAGVLGADVLVTDQMMPGMSGMELVAALRDRGFAGAVILCSAYIDARLEEAARRAGIAACLAKDRQNDLADLIRRVA